MDTFTLTPGETLRDISGKAARYLKEFEGMDILHYQLPEGEYVVHGQARCKTLRRLIGLNKTIQLTFTWIQGDAYSLKIEDAAWWKNLLPLPVSLLVLWPLALICLAGSVNQALLPIRIRKFLRTLSC